MKRDLRCGILDLRFGVCKNRPACHLPARALQWQAGRSRSGEAGGYELYHLTEVERLIFNTQRAMDEH